MPKEGSREGIKATSDSQGNEKTRKLQIRKKPEKKKKSTTLLIRTVTHTVTHREGKRPTKSREEKEAGRDTSENNEAQCVQS